MIFVLNVYSLILIHMFLLLIKLKLRNIIFSITVFPLLDMDIMQSSKVADSDPSKLFVHKYLNIIFQTSVKILGSCHSHTTFQL